MNFPKPKPKTIFDIGYDNLAPSMAIILSIDALHLQRPMHNRKHMWQFKKDISIENSQQKLNFLKRYIVIIQISQLVGSIVTKQRVTAQWSFVISDPDFCDHH